MTQNISASIEVSPKQAASSPDIIGLFPANTRVYITDVGTDSTETMTAAAKRVAELGYRAVPHFAARRLSSKAALRERVARLTQTAGVKDVLIIGGGLEQPAGDFNASMEVLESGFFDEFGISHIGVAGHPEGSPDFDDTQALAALRLKQAFAERSDAQMRIVTQFGFDAAKFIHWTQALQASGIDLPIHLGVAGPTKLTTLIKFAAMCGVGNSLQFLKKRASSIATLATGFDPDSIAMPLETHALREADSAIKAIHVFPFGGIKKSAQWLKARGNWA